MRLLPHSVVVCTAVSADGQPRAMTMSSFTSLALEPTPVVNFNIAAPSRTLDAISEGRTFNVHVLAADESGARAADWFARGNAEGAAVFEDMAAGSGCEPAPAPLGKQEGPRGAPMLRGRGVLYVLRCRLLDEPWQGLVKVRDHVIVLGEVLEIVEGHEREREERFGLVYADRKYRQLGNSIVKS